MVNYNFVYMHTVCTCIMQPLYIVSDQEYVNQSHCQEFCEGEASVDEGELKGNSVIYTCMVMM